MKNIYSPYGIYLIRYLNVICTCTYKIHLRHSIQSQNAILPSRPQHKTYKDFPTYKIIPSLKFKARVSSQIDFFFIPNRQDLPSEHVGAKITCQWPFISLKYALKEGDLNLHACLLSLGKPLLDYNRRCSHQNSLWPVVNIQVGGVMLAIYSTVAI